MRQDNPPHFTSNMDDRLFRTIGVIQAEIDGMKADHSFMISEYLEAKDKRMKCNSWKELADRTRARYERLEKLIL